MNSPPARDAPSEGSLAEQDGVIDLAIVDDDDAAEAASERFREDLGWGGHRRNCDARDGRGWVERDREGRKVAPGHLHAPNRHRVVGVAIDRRDIERNGAAVRAEGEAD